MFDIQNLCRADARSQKIAQTSQNCTKTKFFVIFSGKRAETDTQADGKHEISFNRPNSNLHDLYVNTWQSSTNDQSWTLEEFLSISGGIEIPLDVFVNYVGSVFPF